MMLSVSARSAAPVAAQPQWGAKRSALAQSPSRNPRARAVASAPGATDKKGSAAGFVNRQKFLVPQEVEEPFQAAWKERASHMKTMDGFVDFSMSQSGDIFSVESSWESIPAWEAFNLSPEARRQHLPSGIWQFVPAIGEGFPEDFVPFFDMNTQVNARYPKKKK